MPAEPVVSRTPDGAFHVTLEGDTYLSLMAEALTARLRKLATMLDEIRNTGVPPGSQASWRRGTWA